MKKNASPRPKFNLLFHRRFLHVLFVHAICAFVSVGAVEVYVPFDNISADHIDYSFNGTSSGGDFGPGQASKYMGEMSPGSSITVYVRDAGSVGPYYRLANIIVPPNASSPYYAPVVKVTSGWRTLEKYEIVSDAEILFRKVLAVAAIMLVGSLGVGIVRKLQC